VLVVMAIRFPVSCNVNELRPGTALIGECRRQPRGQLFPACKKILESNRLRDGSVVKEDGDSLPGRKSYLVGCRRIDSSSVHVFPSSTFQLARPFRLVWRKNGIANSETSKDLERLQIDSVLRQPHAFGFASKTKLKVPNAPKQLRKFVATVRERQDHVVIRLRDRRPGCAVVTLTFLVRSKNSAVGLGLFLHHPGK